MPSGNGRRKMQRAYNDTLGKTRDSAVEADGLIGQLQKRIKNLETSLGSAQTVEEIAATNAEIRKLRDELTNLQNITPEQLDRKQFAPILSGEMKILMPEWKVEPPKLAPIVTQMQQQLAVVRETVREGLFGWADDTSAYLSENLMKTEEIVAGYTEALTQKGWRFTEALEYVSSTVGETMRRFDDTVSRFLAQSIEATAEAFGQMLAGDLGFDGLLKAILTQFANFLKQIGAQLIEFGVMIIAFKSALKSVLLNPWAAIAIGAAMVAAAAVMTALINKNAQKNVPKLAKGGLAYGPTYAMVGDNPNAGVDPEVIAPLSKLQAMLPAGGTAQQVQITLGGQLTAKGRDLVYVLGKENFKTEVLGG